MSEHFRLQRHLTVQGLAVLPLGCNMLLSELVVGNVAFLERFLDVVRLFIQILHMISENLLHLLSAELGLFGFESLLQLLKFRLLFVVLRLQISILLSLFFDVVGLCRIFLGEVLSRLQRLLVQAFNLESRILRTAPVLNVVNVITHVGQLSELAHR